MARVPTWAELRLDAEKLFRTQRECYESVHKMLHSDLPSLDQKLTSINSPEPEVFHISSQIFNHHITYVDSDEASIDVTDHQVNNPDHDWSAVDRWKLPLPLSYYFKKNRPGLVLSAEGRARYLKQKSDRRKSLVSSKIMSSFERIRLSSQSNANYCTRKKNTQKTNNNAPLYASRCELTEHEMKRLTARTYKRLPEVRRRKCEEFNNLLKVQNYKNRLEYGRKLLENRRHGVINYPLKSSSGEQSLTSSQSDFSLSGNGRSADFYKADPCY